MLKPKPKSAGSLIKKRKIGSKGLSYAKGMKKFGQAAADAKLVKAVLYSKYKIKNGSFRELVYKHGLTKAKAIIKKEINASINQSGTIKREIIRILQEKLSDKLKLKEYLPSDRKLIIFSSYMQSENRKITDIISVLKKMELNRFNKSPNSLIDEFYSHLNK